MPPRSETLPGGILKLTKLLNHLNASPKLSLVGVKRLRLSLASQNDHFGARHFVKEDLPRIRWANPTLDIEVQREMKTPKEQWKAELEVELQNGQIQKVDMQDKWSTNILKELMDLAGGDPWKRHVQECQRTGKPIIPGDDVKAKAKVPNTSTGKNLPTLEEYLKQNPSKRAEHLKAIETRAAKKTPKPKASSSSTPPPSLKASSLSTPPPSLNPFSSSPEASAPPPS